MRLYSIKDVKAASFDRPFPMPNDNVAIRSVKTLVNEPSQDLCKYPEDFELWYLGELDQATGLLIPGANFLINCIELKEVKNDI